VTWWLYLLACQDGRTYAGIALDVHARFQRHVLGRAAKFTRSNRPLKILGAQSFATRSEALKAEYALKRLKKAAKLEWARQWAVSKTHDPLPSESHEHVITRAAAGRGSGQ
jgi:putative endonuclease